VIRRGFRERAAHEAGAADEQSILGMRAH
jgi:hypothetical protein